MENIKDLKPETRKRRILEIDAIELLTPTEEGVELNEGYEYSVNGALPELADGLAKMAIELDKDTNLGDNAGRAFIGLIEQFYTKLISENEEV